MNDFNTEPQNLKEILTNRTLHALPPIEGEFTWQNIYARVIGPFSPERIISHLKDPQNQEQQVISLDIGGTNITGIRWVVRDGVLQSSDEKVVAFQSTDGMNYLRVLESVADEAAKNSLPVGISFAGPIDGATPGAAPNMKIFLRELREKYEGNFAKLFPTLRSVDNDAVAGLKASVVAIKRMRSSVDKVEYVINGTGLGIAAWTNIIDGVLQREQYIVASESGHHRVPTILNNFGRVGECGMFGARYVCLEMVGAGKGIEEQWAKNKAERLSGEQIEQRLIARDILAGSLYEQAAAITAYVTIGSGEVFGIRGRDDNSAIMFHGGMWKTVGFRERVEQYLEANGGKLQTYTTNERNEEGKKIVPYACAYGAAISALLVK